MKSHVIGSPLISGDMKDTAVMSSKSDPNQKSRSIKSMYLTPINPTDDPITRMLKSWAHAEVFEDPQDVKEYHGIVRDSNAD